MDTTAMFPPAEESGTEEGQEYRWASEQPEDQNQIPDDLLDVFTYGVIQNPVKADDGHIYDAASIRSWFDTCRTRGRWMRGGKGRGKEDRQADRQAGGWPAREEG